MTNKPRQGGLFLLFITFSLFTLIVSGCTSGGSSGHSHVFPTPSPSTSPTTSPSPSPSPTIIPSTGAVSGTVTDQSSNPISGAKISLAIKSSVVITDTTASDGTYRLDNVPEGTHTVTVECDGYQNSAHNVNIDQANPDAVLNVQMEAVPPDSGTITGTVTIFGDNPEGVLVYTGNLFSLTDSNGVYTINGVPEGTGLALNCKSGNRTWTHAVDVTGGAVTNRDFDVVFNQTIETVDTGGNLGAPSLALDSSDNPYISYINTTSSELKYAYNDGSWHNESIHNCANPGLTSITLDASERPYIGFIDDETLNYIYHDGANWTTQYVADQAANGTIDTFLDSSGTLHFGYYNTTSEVVYGTYDGTWTPNIGENTNALFAIGAFESMTMDSSNNPHFCYYNDNEDRFTYAYFDGSWHVEKVDNLDMGFISSITLDSQGNPRLSYLDFNGKALKYARRDTNGHWNTSTVDRTGFSGWFSSIAVDSWGDTHISYCDGENMLLKYAYHNNGKWHIYTIDTIGVPGVTAPAELFGTCIRLDSSDNPRAAYRDAANDSAKYFKGEIVLLP